jgi:antitoxin (DNA-binding transcriptional repressor) of toxin-antitoxin stability system
MRKVGIKALKNELSKHIRVVAAGETILVTDRDRVVAELRPPPPEGAGDEASRNWARMIRAGIVTPARRPFTELPPRLPQLMTFEELMREIEEDREDR